MTIERTFSMIKPDATRRNLTGAIISRFEEAGLRIIASQRIKMSLNQAKGLYSEHAGKPFFPGLCDFMTSGPVVIQVLEGENAINANREIMGATDPAKAAAGTIRGDFGEGMPSNSCHGSDNLDAADWEIALFFDDDEIVP